VSHSRVEIYDFLTAIGVTFDRIAPSHGNSIPRFHMTHRRGLNLVRPLFREALRYPNITFVWNTQATDLIMRNGKVAGLHTMNLRTQRSEDVACSAVVLATGGFQRNLEKAQKYWPPQDPRPSRLLTGSGKYSLGLGLDMAMRAGAAVYRIDRQYNIYTAIPDPRDPTGTLGLSAGNNQAIWVNALGRRFVNPQGFDKDVYPTVLAQPGGTYWAVFDARSKGDFKVGTADWGDRPAVAAQVLEDSSLTKTGNTLAELAAAAQLPPAALEETVRRYNQLVDAGDDADFGSFSATTKTRPRTIIAAPFYAVQFFPAAHKNMGGVAINIHAQVLDQRQQPIPGLFAGGEITGSAGINGSAGLDGTFTGPSILTGRIAGQSAAAYVKATADRKSVQAPVAIPPHEGGWIATMNAEELKARLNTALPGFWHFEQVHRSVLKRETPCNECHSALVPQAPATDAATMRALSDTCDACHTAPISR
jgi:succinate dehydrogenase/fumarate reductase flavoprotein subunit